MQYAQILPKLKMNLKEELFTYSIPPNFLFEIKIGQLVEIPFSNRKTIGIVYNIVRQLSAKIDRTKIKKISKIFRIDPIVNQEVFSLAKWIADNHLTSISKSLFSIIPIPTRNKMKVKSIKTNQFEPLILKHRFDEILPEIKNAVNQNKSILILCPETNIAEVYYQIAQKYFDENKIALYHSDLNQSQKWDVYQRLFDGENLIVFGTQISAFLPFDNLKTAFIEFADFNGFISDRIPKYDVRDILLYKKSLRYFKLIFSSTTLPIKFIPYYKRRFLYWQKLKNTNKPKILTVSAPQKYLELLSDSLYLEIKKTLFNKKRVLIMLNKKGWAKIGICPDCGEVLKCENCQKPLTKISEKYSFCYQCQEKYAIDYNCKSCKGTRLKFIVYGLDFLENELKNKFPNTNIAKISRSDKKIPIQSLDKFQIIIGTQKIFSQVFEHVDLSVFLSPETFKFTSGYQDRENYFQTLNKLLFLTDNKLVIQTDDILDEKNDLVLKASDFYLSEIKNRSRFFYPPFSKIIKIKFRATDEKKSKKEANKLYQVLIKKRLDISDPIPQIPYKNKNGFGWEITIKVKEIKTELKNLIPNSWNIEVES